MMMHGLTNPKFVIYVSLAVTDLITQLYDTGKKNYYDAFKENKNKKVALS
jgi:hypothetical protein